MRRLIVFVCSLACCIVLVLGGCKSGNEKDILSPEMMQVVLWDMLRADEMAMSENVKDTVRTRYLTHSVHAYQQVFAIHHITKEQFYRSLRYYQERPDKNKALLDSVQAIGNRVKAGQERRDSLDRVALLKKDSIRLKLDSVKLKTDISTSKLDTAKARLDSIKIKADAARKLLADSITAKAERARLQRTFPATLRKGPLAGRLRRDSLIKLNLKPGASIKPIH